MSHTLDRFTSRRSPVRANNGLVATSQPLAAEAGVEILRRGGNAFDAAVATAAALNVVEPTSTGLGGDVFALYRTADGTVGGLSACGTAPANTSRDAIRNAIRQEDDISHWYPASRGYAVDGQTNKDDLEMPFLGPHAVTVPGTARGWERTLEELGTMAFSEVLAPAIEYAREGYPVSDVIAYYWQSAETLFRDDHARDAYLFEGSAPEPGQIVKLPKLANSFEQIAADGADAVYRGPIGEAIVDEIQSKGGFMTMDDLADFEAEFVEPISTTYHGAEIFELPPSNQGLIALEALNIAEEIDAGEHPVNSPERVHAFAEAMKLAFVDGHHYITDPEFEDIPPLASKKYARERAQAISATPIADPSIGVPDAPAEDTDTVLLTVGDKEGNLVSYINSRFAGFGSGLVAGDTGIALQNRGASFSLDSTHPNRLEPRKRPFHTLVPAIARFAEDDWAAFGVMGGYMQPQGHVQVISNIVDYDLGVQEALDAPRWRIRESGTLGVEERLSNTTALARMGHDVRILTPTLFGGAQLVRRQGQALVGGTEPRKDGSVAGY